MSHEIRLVLLVATISMATVFGSSAFAEHEREVYMMKRDGTELRTIETEPAPGLTNCGTPDWSSDGTRLLFDATPGRSWDRARIFSLHVSGPSVGQLDDLGSGVVPAFSPNGDYVAFHWSGWVMMMNADGSDRKDICGGGRAYLAGDNRTVLLEPEMFRPHFLYTATTEGISDNPLLVPSDARPESFGWFGKSKTIVLSYVVGAKHTVSLFELNEEGPETAPGSPRPSTR